jgi:hypothetical protein
MRHLTRAGHIILRIAVFSAKLKQGLRLKRASVGVLDDEATDF